MGGPRQHHRRQRGQGDGPRTPHEQHDGPASATPRPDKHVHDGASSLEVEQYDGASVGLHASTVNSFGKTFETFEITHTFKQQTSQQLKPHLMNPQAA
ncbi:hypothetical protein TPA0905_54930 [Streptomyces olivaceus]|nr:hypothetical protein TPA0905_54930 [Streptomyces olivaceus]